MSWSAHPPVVGMDTNSFGFHAVSSVPISMPGGAEQTFGWLTGPSRDFLDRLREVHHGALSWFSTLPSGSSVWCEESLVLSQNPETTRKLVMMTGVLYAAFMEAGPDASWFFVNVSTWRKDVLRPPKGESPRNKEGWKSLAKAHVLAGWPKPAEGGSYEERQEFQSNMQALVDMWDSQADLYEAACLMEYGMQQISKGAVTLR